MLDLVHEQLFDCHEEIVIEVDLNYLVEEVLLLEAFVLVEGRLVGLLEYLDALLDLSPAYHLPALGNNLLGDPPQHLQSLID